jgi:VWFA-related protein
MLRPLLAFALALGLLTGEARAESDRDPVRLDAIAADPAGRIVPDLAPADFEILDEGRARVVESVRLVRADGTARPGEALLPIQSATDERREAARDGARIFAFFLDEYHLAPGADTSRARDALSRFIDAHLGPRDLLLVVKPLDSLVTLRLTRDMELVRQAVAALEGRKGRLEPRNAFERDYFAGSPTRIEAMREQIVASALHAVATHLGGLGAVRKTLVVLSEGFGPRPRSRGEESLPTLASVVRTANRSGVTIYALDPSDSSGSSPAEHESSRKREAQDALRALAAGTGGRAVLQASNLAEALSAVAADASAYYLITFPSDGEADGTFHSLAVRMKRPGVQLRVRAGYWAPRTDDPWRLAATSSGPARPPELPRRTSPLIRPWFGQSRGDAGRTRVSFVWEPASRVPGDRSQRPVPARITLQASTPDGTLVFEGPVQPTGSTALPGQAGGPYSAVFETPPGRIRVLMSIEDAAARIVDTDVRDVVVGSLHGSAVFGTASVLRAGSARAFRELAGNLAAAPAAAREFSRTERLLIRVPVYAAEPPAVVKATLVSEHGQTMRELAVSRATAPPELHEVDVPLAGLAPGAYFVRLAVTGPAGEASETVSFRVTP